MFIATFSISSQANPKIELKQTRLRSTQIGFGGWFASQNLSVTQSPITES